ncbi:MAG: lipoate--protein ligase [Eubacteriales bacterium]|nr:lipoate--protein ligase [Eubacteriales bacterium]
MMNYKHQHNMENTMYYMETGSTDPAYNLAFEQYVLENCLSGSYVILWQNDNAIIIGRNQNTLQEINRQYVEDKGIRVVRRMTGGGAVYHDLGNLNYSYITDYNENISMEAFNAPVCRALRELGLNAESSGRNDITVDGKKVSGVAQRIYKNRILHHGCILFAADTSVLSGALNADPEKFTSKSVKSVSSRVANISDLLEEKIGMDEFKKRIRKELIGSGAETFFLSDTELDLIEDLAEKKYRSWEWNYGHSPEYTFHNKKRFAAGSIEVFLNVKNGYITDVVFFGDFMAQTDHTAASEALKGVRYCREDVRKALDIPDLDRMFGGITAENIADVIS